jgi:tripeptidyl-peptidase I
VTPTCVRQAYDIEYNAEPNRTTFAVYGTEAASFSPTDLQTYLSRYNKPAAADHAAYRVVGNGDPDEDSDLTAKFETALDTQTLLGLAWPAKGVLYRNGGVFGPNPGSTYDPFVQFIQELITNTTVPSVVSFSESMPEAMMDENYARRLCNMMAQVGARGITLLFSSGNNGPNGDQPTGTHDKVFEPEFPASCPWVTAVGGTTNLADETAATKSTISIVGKLGYIASGGGFSNLFTTPVYQSRQVDRYRAKHVPESYLSEPGYNPRGRGIPDVSAFSTNHPTVVDYITFPIGGTSSSTPLWAAIITLLNDYEAWKGRKPLGFINPWLYRLTSGLKDITTGGNNAGDCYLLTGCTLDKTLGYNVTEGWDPVTGLGSPIFSELRKALDELAEQSAS